MPAIDRSKLNLQAARLADNFSNHRGFLREFHEILDLYTNRTFRPSRVAMRMYLPTYHTPMPVLRSLARELAPLADRFPEKGRILVTELWQDKTLESRLLAATLLGMLPPNEAIHLLTRLPDWLLETTDKILQQALLNKALIRIREESPEAFYMLLEDWLQSSTKSYQIWGMQALLPVLLKTDFSNLPTIFRLLRPAFLSVSPTSQNEFRDCVIALEKISIIETKTFLLDLLSSNPAPMFYRILRRILPSLSRGLQSSIREALRDNVAVGITRL